MLLSGSAEASTPSQRLTAAALLLELDNKFHAQRLNCQVRRQEQASGVSAPPRVKEKKNLSADEIVATFCSARMDNHAEATG